MIRYVNNNTTKAWVQYFEPWYYEDASNAKQLPISNYQIFDLDWDRTELTDY